jgi:hypothetical protein
MPCSFYRASLPSVRWRIPSSVQSGDIRLNYSGSLYAGLANALRALLKEELERGHDVLRLANALSALYPKDSEEKRLLDAMLLAMPR